MPKCSLQLSLYQYLHRTLATPAQVVLLLEMQTSSKIIFQKAIFCEGKWKFFWSTLRIFYFWNGKSQNNLIIQIQGIQVVTLNPLTSPSIDLQKWIE